ncbi:MAG: DUF1232 domain-containing protein [Limnothrix sp.]
MSESKLKKITSSIFQTIKQSQSKSKQVVTKIFTRKPHSELRKLNKEEETAFWAVLFAVASVDGRSDSSEQEYLKSLIQDDEIYTEISQSFKESPVDYLKVAEYLQTLKDTDKKVWWRLLFWSLEVASLDNKTHESEQETILQIRQTFDISAEQFATVVELVDLLQLVSEQTISAEETHTKFCEIQERAKKLDVILPKEVESIVEKNLGKYEQYYSEKNLKEKLAKYAVVTGKKTVELVLTLFYTLQQKDIPIKYKAVIVGALGYWILPPDLLPDVIPAIGYSDDLSTLLMAMAVVTTHIDDEVRQKAKDKLKDWFGEGEGDTLVSPKGEESVTEVSL